MTEFQAVKRKSHSKTTLTLYQTTRPYQDAPPPPLLSDRILYKMKIALLLLIERQGL